MFFNKLRYPLVLVVLFVAGLAFVATPATAAVVPVLSVPDEVPDVGGPMIPRKASKYTASGLKTFLLS